MAIFTTLRGKIHNSIQHKLQNSVEVASMAIIAIFSMSYITTRIVKTQTSVAKIPRLPIEKQITILSVLKIAIKFLREILYKNISIITIQHSKFILLTPLTIFTILLSEIHSSPSGKFPYTYQLKLPVWRVVITIQYGKNRHTTWQNAQQYIAQITKQYGSRQYGNYCHTQYVLYYHTHSKNIDKCGENPQSAHRKTNYHTKCGKNWHKILSVQ